MSEVFWKRHKPDRDGVVWNDLLCKGDWIITYRETQHKWLVLYRDSYNGLDKYVDRATMPEEQLRNDLRLNYLLNRGGANNVR